MAWLRKHYKKKWQHGRSGSPNQHIFGQRNRSGESHRHGNIPGGIRRRKYGGASTEQIHNQPATR